VAQSSSLAAGSAVAALVGGVAGASL